MTIKTVKGVKEMGNVDKILKKQISVAVLKYCLKQFINENAYTITESIPTLLSPLETIYEKVSAEEINDRAGKLKMNFVDK